ncbi:type II toxin-antitoxin system RelB/DinJ family antitoxin [uncultured Methylobacterium sp.]|uniref:type II toxin-antitoxin system RelB/DinJ family antitoxin n=1 Tax=uncultured Methylobacterium sp. TaxID=157278 RepID=UPI0025943545|nr:type II toxin-antitoxin system RelB/DinJ family antitoxin [uncultured Methylobacterium sp.]
MAARALVTTEIDASTEREAAAVLEAMGLTVSDAIRLMLTRVAREGTVPLDLLAPNETPFAAMQEARAGQLPRFDSAEALLADLHADD